MKIQVYDIKNAPKWVQIVNILNLFLFGFAVGKFFGEGLQSPFVSWFTLYGCIYALTIGQFFIPKKHIEFPKAFFRYLRDQWSAI